MKRITILLLALLTINISSYSQINDTKAKSILEEISKKAKTFDNLKFQFNYRMQDKAHKIDNSLPGSIVMDGDMYNLHIMGRNIVSDGTTLWTHDPDAEEIQISNVDKSKDSFGFLKVITSVDDSYKAKYIKSAKENGRDIHIIDLTPKEAKSYYKIRIKVDKVNSWINEAIIFEKDNIQYTFNVEKFETNLNLPKGYFKIDANKYPDSEVVDLR
ncbi:MAG: outer membrane lipoprotein carrier protein LolA [Bacteroidales bacterium]|nr:outer membrane lipoprotein carrier protein LolA [Bacteroidales bacterium]